MGRGEQDSRGFTNGELATLAAIAFNVDPADIDKVVIVGMGKCTENGCGQRDGIYITRSNMFGSLSIEMLERAMIEIATEDHQ